MQFHKLLLSACLAVASLHATYSLAAPAGGQAPNGTAERVMTFGKGKFKAPETVIWDEREDVYLVSNVNGKLTMRDDDGFISRVSPEGEILDLKWIDGASGPQVMLHGPKDMLLVDDYLVVADVGAVRYFDRTSGEPVNAVVVPQAHMLNALALDPDGKTLYVSDTGGDTDEKPGAIFRIEQGAKPQRIAQGPELDRPNGIAWHEGGLLVAPFDQHADQLYRVSLSGEQDPAATLPKAQLDGLLRLPDGTTVVTSWQGEAIYRINGKQVETVGDGVKRPAQIGHDAKRNRLLVPSAKDNVVIVYALGQAG